LQKMKLVQAADSSGNGTPASALRKALETLRELEPIGDVRGIGMLWGVEFVADKPSKKPFASALNFAGRVAQAAMRCGLLVYPMQGSVDGVSGDHLLIAPPAVITQEQIQWAVDQLRDSIQETAGSRPRSA
jgi:adenosylmethionine-8-amino-7-oxononanoate aminotransferase